MLNVMSRAVTLPPPAPTYLTPTATESRSNETPPTHASQTPSSSNPTRLARKLAANENLKQCALKLKEVAARLGEKASPSAVWNALRTTLMDVHPDSSYATKAGSSVSLAKFLRSHTLPLSHSHDHLVRTADWITDKAMQHPLENFGGALSWPAPMGADELLRLQRTTADTRHPLGDRPDVKGTQGGILEFLRYQSPLPPQTLGDPLKMLEALLDSPPARQIGKALQQTMQGVASDSSASDYLLAGVLLQLDPASRTDPQRNTVAGFKLSSDKHWGKPASTVVDALAEHLTTTGKTSPDLAKVGAYLLLASRAPVFLIKDIPASVTYGSPAWVNLAIAAATLEAQTPGKVANLTFAQVMLKAESAAKADPEVTQIAQREALIDWGVANGVLQTKADALYGADELSALVTTYDARQTLMNNAAEAFAKDIPSRKEMAMAELRKRFPDQEALFDQKMFHVSRKAFYLGQDTYETVEIGPHSLLDIAMMDLKGPNLVFTSESKDSEIFLNALNANHAFGVADEFEQQFKDVVEEKKRAVNTCIKHLIAQLPLEDRKHFEYGNVTLYQKHSYKMGTGFFDRTPLPKDEALLIKIERDGVTIAYQISFNEGRIYTIPTYQAAPGSTTHGNLVRQTKTFTPTGGDIGSERAPTNDSPPDSFTRERTQRIADAFIEHIGLDDPAIKRRARGLTTADKNRQKADVVGEFILNLIPLRSAINNFRAGNIGEGLVDLGLDVFGFLTAGAATAGKVMKIAGSAASSASKAARIGKAIGVASIGLLNPVAGTGDLAAGGVKLMGKGLAKAREWTNTLRGASGSYDLLKTASRQYDAAAIGTLKIAEQTVQTPAVFKDGHWYHYNVAKAEAYGQPLKDFKPIVAAHEGEIKAIIDSWLGKFLGSIVAPPSTNPNYRQDYISAIAKAKVDDPAAYQRGYLSGTPSNIYGYSSALKVEDLKRLAVNERRAPAELGSLVKRIEDLERLPEHFKIARQNAQVAHPAAYKKGYDTGTPEHISGFSDSLTLNELAELAVAPGRTPEELGRLTRYMERRRTSISLENYKEFNKEITAAGGTPVAVPQSFYLSQASLLSEGECAALSNVMAAAIKEGKQDTFIKNLYTAMVPTLSPAEIAALRKVDPAKAAIEQRKATSVSHFQEQLEALQEVLGKNTGFHHNMQFKQAPYTDIIETLANARSSKTLLINGPSHGITAGVVVNNGKKEWFYFDPNFGKATFTTQAQMRDALESTLKRGRTKSLLEHFGSPDMPEYRFSVFDRINLNAMTSPLPRHMRNVDDLFDLPL
ncbi:hypothetical protein [Pseudomonas lactucae]|uniref:hypothetical protein n=1 Tax=Pseudomonas lactucae TaxID=2813360 RepID=UPI002FCCB9B6